MDSTWAPGKKGNMILLNLTSFIKTANRDANTQSIVPDMMVGKGSARNSHISNNY